MKIFWSWQSDTSGKVGRFFVRDAINDAIKALKEDPEIEEPLTRDVELDHDRKNVPGSPDLAATIFKKIDESLVFIADVTPKAEFKRPNEDGKIETKKVMNANVAIELGYALRSLTSENILLVCNKSFGKRSDLPFDLQHKSGPIFFSLPEKATTEDIDNERQALVNQLKISLKPYILNGKTTNAAPHKELKPNQDTGVFFGPSDTLVKAEYSEDFDSELHGLTWGPRFSLRAIPVEKVPKRFQRAEIRELAEARSFRNFSRESYGFTSFNKDGVIKWYAKPNRSGELTSISQIFKNYEIWSVTNELIRESNGNLIIGYVPLQKAIENKVISDLEFYSHTIGSSAKIVFEFKSIDTIDCKLPIGEQHNYFNKPLLEDLEGTRATLIPEKPNEAKNYSFQCINDLFDAAGEPPFFELER